MKIMHKIDEYGNHYYINQNQVNKDKIRAKKVYSDFGSEEIVYISKKQFLRLKDA